MRRSHWGCAIVAVAGLIPSSLLGQQTEPSTSEVDTDEVIEQILDLREQLEALLSGLPPELRDEVELRWNHRLDAARPADSADASPAPLEPPSRSSADPAGDLEPSVTTAADVDPSEAELRLESGDSIPLDNLVEPTATIEEITIAEGEVTSPECVHLAAFDTNEDRVVSSGDRYWRYLRLWEDNGDGVVNEELEIESLFELEIREIRVELDYYGLPNDVSGDITVGDEVQLILVDTKRNAASPATLVVQAGRMARGGQIWIADEAGRVLDGYQVVGPAILAETAAGIKMPLVCP